MGVINIGGVEFRCLGIYSFSGERFLHKEIKGAGYWVLI